MKSIEELKKEKTTLIDKREKLYTQRCELSNEIEELNFKIKSLNEQITEYDKFKAQEEKREYEKRILKWLTGQSEKTYNVGYYEGIVCPSCNIFEYKREQPKGTQEEIIEILKEKDIKMLTFSTHFHSGGLWGDDVLGIHLHKEL